MVCGSSRSSRGARLVLFRRSMSRGARDPGAAAGIGSLSMRDNYAGGVAEYYTHVGATYRNPHFPGVKLGCFHFLNAFVNCRYLASIGT